MSQVLRLANKCDQCDHEWLPKAAAPKHCARCKSRSWNVVARLAKRAKEKEEQSK